jgi:hypothetical protein
MGYQRRFGSEHSVVLVNYAKQPAQVDVKTLPPNARLLSAYPGPASLTTAADARGLAAVSVPGQSVQVWTVAR